MTQRTVTAMYDSSSAAEAARDRLVGIGVPSAAITIRGTGASTGTTTTAGDDTRSFWEELKSLFVPDEDRHTYAEGLRRGSYLLTAQVPAGLEDQVYDVLEDSGAVDLDTRTSEWQASGWKGYGTEGVTGGTASSESGVAATGAGAGYASGTTATTGTDTAFAASDERATAAGSGAALAGGTGARAVTEGEETIQAAEEQLHVGKREVGRGSVRVRSYVTERPVEEQVELRQERVTVERRPVERELQPGEAAFQERTIEAVERGEEAVVDKRARVTEEIGLRKDVATETETVRDTVRKQEVEVEEDRVGGDLAGEERVTTTRDRTAG
jgi:uncharacterized protein (TIGR02271 family)